MIQEEQPTAQPSVRGAVGCSYVVKRESERVAQRRLILVVVVIIVVVTDTVSIEELLARVIEVVDETH